MQKLIYLPNVELNMEGVRVTAWSVKVGDRVAIDQTLLEVETQKAVIEVPSPEAGYVRALHVAVGDEVGERSLLCTLTDTADEPLEEAAGANPQSSPAITAPAATAATEKAATDSGEIRAAPAARKMAREAGLAMETIRGTGPEGRITVADVEAALAGGQDAAGTQASGAWTPLAASRVALNAQMTRSLAEIPQIHLSRQMDVTPLMLKVEGITFTHRLIQAAATALVAHPALRTQLDGNRVRVAPVSVAVAMDTAHGLVAPVIREAERLGLAQIVEIFNDYRVRAGGNALRREELIDGPFAITNLGMFGIDMFNAFVFHGQTAVLAVGRAADGHAQSKKAWFNLAVDHRIVDGAEAARFLATLQAAILEVEA